jgi:hypothetical protein
LIGARALVDRLNVCDSREESDHAYSFHSSTGALRLWGAVRMDGYPGGGAPFADGGRAILGSESFRISAATGRDLLVVLRTAPAIDANLLQVSGPRRVGLEFPEAVFSIAIDGQTAVRETFRTQAGWNEHAVRIAGNLVQGPRPRLEVSGRYASFQYWFFQ